MQDPTLGSLVLTRIRRALSPAYWTGLIRYHVPYNAQETSQIQNHRDSPFLQLPAEILLSILEHTSDLERLCARQVCTRLRCCIGRLEQATVANSPTVACYALKLDQIVRYALMRRLNQRYRREDRFHQKYRRNAGEDRGCMGCMKLHSRKDFLQPEFLPRYVICSFYCICNALSECPGLV